jgi:hypothetical protein
MWRAQPAAERWRRRRLQSIRKLRIVGHMKPRDLYSSHVLVAGVILLVLGIGNWIVGAVQVTQYRSLLRSNSRTGLEESYRSFQELTREKNQGILRRINEDREKYNAARVKLDFSYVVLRGGRVLFLVGLALTLYALIKLIRQDTLTKIRRLKSLYK